MYFGRSFCEQYPFYDDLVLCFCLDSVKKEMIIAKIRTNFDDLRSETRCWSISKSLWGKRVYHLSDTKGVEDDKHVRW